MAALYAGAEPVIVPTKRSSGRIGLSGRSFFMDVRFNSVNFRAMRFRKRLSRFKLVTNAHRSWLAITL